MNIYILKRFLIILIWKCDKNIYNVYNLINNVIVYIIYCELDKFISI